MPLLLQSIAKLLRVLAFGLAVSAIPASAATRTVTNKNDSGLGSLRQTIAAAASGDTIQFAPNVTGTISLTGGALQLTKNVTIVGPGAANLTISGNGTDRVFFNDPQAPMTPATPPAANVIISGLTIANGIGTYGGGIFVSYTFKISDCVFRDCVAGGGGAIYSAGTLELQNCTFTGNTATSVGGGAIGNAGTMTIVGCVISGNNAVASFGGGIENLGIMTVSACSISANGATIGGGIANGAANFGVGSLNLNSSTIANNTATDGFGGGIYSFSSSSLTITNCTVTLNRTPEVSGSNFTRGGGIYNEGGFAMSSCTIAGNGSGLFGGGLYNGNPAASIGNTIIAGNTVNAAGTGSDCSGFFPSADYNLIQNASGFTFSGTTAHNITGQDPRLGILANNGGPTLTLALLSGSPAINSGDDLVLGAPFFLSADQRGFSRKVGVRVDIGAFELEIVVNPPPPVANAPDQVKDFNGDGKTDLVWQHDGGDIGVWLLDGINRIVGTLFNPGQTDPAWKISGVGDFNGDGKLDLVFRNDNGQVGVWLLDGINRIVGTLFNPGQTDPSWKIASVGDFNQDGKPDLVWRHDNGTICVWFMNGINLISSSFFSPGKVDPSWKIVGVGDFNQDNNLDLVWRHDSGAICVWFMEGIIFVSSSFFNPAQTDPSWKISGVGDFNQDKKPDLIWRHDGGAIVVWYMNGINIAGEAFFNPSAADPTWKIQNH